MLYIYVYMIFINVSVSPIFKSSCSCVHVCVCAALLSTEHDFSYAGRSWWALQNERFWSLLQAQDGPTYTHAGPDCMGGAHCTGPESPEKIHVGLWDNVVLEITKWWKSTLANHRGNEIYMLFSVPLVYECAQNKACPDIPHKYVIIARLVHFI